MKHIYITSKENYQGIDLEKIDRDLSMAGYLHKSYNDKPVLFCNENDMEDFKSELESALSDKVVLERI